MISILIGAPFLKAKQLVSSVENKYTGEITYHLILTQLYYM